MQLTIISKLYGTQRIDTDKIEQCFNPACTIFKIVEHLFNEWYIYATQPGAPMNKDIVGMYNGEADQPAIYSKSGAICQGIEGFIELASDDTKEVYTTRDIMNMDIECAFE